MKIDGRSVADARLEAVAENLREGLVIADSSGRMLHWNRAALAMHGYDSLDNVLRMTPEFASQFAFAELDTDRIVPFEDWPFPRVLRGETLRDHTVRVTRGAWSRVFSYSGAMIEDATGERTAYVTITDVTERHLAAQHLRDTEARHRATLDCLMEGCQIIDRSFRYVYVNETAARHGRRPASELIGRTMSEAYPGIQGTELHAKLQTCMTERRPVSFENDFTYPDGQRAIFELVLQPVPDGVLVASLDVTERRLAAAAVARMNETLEHHVAARTAELERANKELEAFSYSVSHDLRAPLRAIDGFSHALLDEHEALLPEEGRRYLRTIRARAQRMGALIDDLLALARLSRLPLVAREVDMQGLVAEALDELADLRVHRDVDLRVDPLPPAVGDAAMLKQVWANLLSNALKYTGNVERAVIHVGSREEDGARVYFVKDNGTGFDMRYVHKLFGVFSRLHREDEYEGTGVGLAIVQRVVARLGGRVWAEAVVGEGATFHFTVDAGAHR
ncbi:MAG: hypothetical protein JWP97_3913 [Labilithrix sp.]|nr:hypothetical protein [Labilithrix sp.]